MSKITSAIEFGVIDEYSRGQTLDQIAEKTNLSKGSVYNIIKKWKSRLVEGNVDEIRKFRNLLKKSGITIEDCVLGFRMVNILDKFNLHDDFEKPLADLLLSGSVQIEKTNVSDLEEFADDYLTDDLKDIENIRIKGNEILSFLSEIYEQCRANNIKPTYILKWIKDLLDHFSHTEKSEKTPGGNNGNSNLINKDELIEIPLITKINTFLDIKKQEHVIQKKQLSKTYQDLNTISDKVALKSDELYKIEVREKVTLQYLNWYQHLRSSLKNRYEISIEQIMDDFTKMINEFQDYGFDTINVIIDYGKMKSIKTERNVIQKEIDDKIRIRDSLNTEIQERKFDLMKINKLYWPIIL